MKRRSFIKGSLGGMLSVPFINPLQAAAAYSENTSSKIKLSLNAYSFNSDLKNGKMDLFDLLRFSAQTGFDAVDTTAYYFPGYPKVPSDKYLNSIKREAFMSGLEISGTGIRNNFCKAEKSERQKDIELIKEWIRAASKLGVPVLRIFAGKNMPVGYSRGQIYDWMLRDIQVAVDYGKEYGVLIAIQNHNEFLKSSEEVKKLLDDINSAWFGLILDIGSLRLSNPYDEIKKLVSYAVSWQIKEHVYFNNEKRKTDYSQIIKIARDANYRGYFPLETLVKENVREQVTALYNTVKNLLS